jgi:tRNA pseudouridine55 synthase
MARRKPSKMHGLLIVDKPAGITSHDVVGLARRHLGERRIGHAGTLDPDATGMMLLGVGNATRLLRFITILPKTYETEIVLGSTTSTLDDSGDITATFDMSAPSQEQLSDATAKLTGNIEQIPPMVSAVKVDGKRLYELEREGIEVEREARPVTVYDYEVSPTADPLVLNARITCGSGTYVRSLAADLGTLLGGGAHIRRLRRTRSGSFTPDEATGVDDFALRPMAEVMRDYASVVVEQEAAVKLGNGGFLPDHPGGDGPWAVFNPSGELIAVHELNEHGQVRPGVVIPQVL